MKGDVLGLKSTVNSHHERLHLDLKKVLHVIALFGVFQNIVSVIEIIVLCFKTN